MMLSKTLLAGVMALAILAACSKTAPPPAETVPSIDRAKMAASLLDLLDTAPQCQAFRDQLEKAGRTPADVPLDVNMMGQVVADAHAAGCSKKSAQQ